MSTKKCPQCHGEMHDGVLYDLTFKKDGLTFHIPILAGSNCRECEEKDVWKNFKDFGKRLVRRDENSKGQFSIDWKYFCSVEDREYLYCLMDVLVSLGVLSIKTSGNWLILDGSVTTVLNPRGVAFTYYFVRREDVLEYANIDFGSAKYGYELIHMGKVINSGTLAAIPTNALAHAPAHTSTLAPAGASN